MCLCLFAAFCHSHTLFVSLCAGCRLFDAISIYGHSNGFSMDTYGIVWITKAFTPFLYVLEVVLSSNMFGLYSNSILRNNNMLKVEKQKHINQAMLRDKLNCVRFNLHFETF